MRRLILFFLFAAFALNGCALFTNCSDDPQCVRVLFIGNSYTFVNDLPTTLTKLAEAGGQRVETVMQAEGGWTLAQHADSTVTLDQIDSKKWNFVVLQEQSQIPASQSAREAGMYPAVRKLALKIKAVGATPMLFVTWGHRAGWPENGLPGYETMQLQLNGGYLAIGQELKVPLSPVGYAWLAMSRQHPQIDLWQEDGSHPNEQGTYLAACVFYTVIFHKSSEGLSYVGNVSKENAALIQKIASDTVLNNAKKWNLPDLPQK
jgi:hypothetical protein